MGHGVSATILGLTAFGLKNRISGSFKGALIGASSAMEVAVGASLIFIGLLGIKEAREFGNEDEGEGEALVVAEKAQKRAVIFNGLLHGFSWDGAVLSVSAVDDSGFSPDTCCVRGMPVSCGLGGFVPRL